MYSNSAITFCEYKRWRSFTSNSKCSSKQWRKDYGVFFFLFWQDYSACCTKSFNAMHLILTSYFVSFLNNIDSSNLTNWFENWTFAIRDNYTILFESNKPNNLDMQSLVSPKENFYGWLFFEKPVWGRCTR